MGKNIQDDFDKWTSQWEKAMETDDFKSAPKPPTPAPQHSGDFFGQYPPASTSKTHESDVEYWNQVYRMSRGESPDPLNSDDESLVTEEKETSKVDLDRQSKVARSTSNPIPYWSVGKDQDINLPGVKEIQELHDMKVSLEQLESKLNANEGLGKDGAAMQKKIDALRQQIDDLSDALTPSRFATEANRNRK